MTILLDFETRSRCDLRAEGGRRYAEHPSTEAICCVLYDTESGDVGTWEPGEPCPVSPDDELGAHNASGFDRFIAARVWGEAFAHQNWIDTSELARRAGLPGALDALGTRWLDLPKDKVASRFTAGLSTARRPSGKKNPDAISPEAWKAMSSAEKRERGVLKSLTPEVRAKVLAYCASDVEILATGWEDLRPFLDEGVFSGDEAEVLAVDRIVNDRGVALDVDLARALLAASERNAERAVSAAAKAWRESVEATRACVQAPAQFAEVLGLANAQAQTVEALLVSPPDEPTRLLALARQAVNPFAAGKIEAGLARVGADGQLRDQQRYYGAHTGRWAHPGMQLGNMPRPEARFETWDDDDIERLADRALAGEDLDDGEILVAMRACILGNAVCDFAGVEARGTAWVAGDAKALDVFMSGRDPYKVAAATIFDVDFDSVNGVQRTAGKMAELACGYQGGTGALERIAGKYGIDLRSMGVDPQQVVDGWRKLHKPIVLFWRAVQNAFLRAAEGHSGKVACFDFEPSTDGRDVAIFLPSGRPIVYGHVQISEGKYGPEATYVGGWNPVWKCPRCPAKDSTAPAPMTVRLTDRSTCSRCGAVSIPLGLEKLYGGLITENIVQAMCRDLLADAMVRAERAGLPVVLTVHDEIVVEHDAAEEAATELKRIMLELPGWARGFPVGAKAHHGRRYRK